MKLSCEHYCIHFSEREVPPHVHITIIIVVGGQGYIYMVKICMVSTTVNKQWFSCTCITCSLSC